MACDPELLSNWAKYLCVLISGFIEESVHVLILKYVKRKASPDVQHFIGCKMKDFQNAKMGKILELLGEFSVELKMGIETATEGELKDAIDSVVQNRHLIAHGRTIGISFVTIKDYYGRVLKVVELLETALAS
ncbi:MAG: HEPN domain-containing protein [Anaerohalosphaeraceae bacterium]